MKPYLILLFCQLAASILPAAKPNFLFIFVDDLRPELGCYGTEKVQSPSIDSLAEQGVTFDNAYCQQAVCLPSRISLLTGMHPDSTGVHDLKTKFRETIPNATTLPEYFKANGYDAIGMGKVFHDEQPNAWTTWIDVDSEADIHEYHAPETVREINRRLDEANAKGLNGWKAKQYAKGPAYESADAADSEYHDGAMTDLAIEQLKAQREQPFFMTVGYKRPHLPFVAPQKYWDLYDAADIHLPSNYFKPEGSPQVAWMTWGELRNYDDIPKQGELDEATALQLIHGYYACVSFIDAQIARLLATLESEGLAENTVVVLTGDHGFKIGEHAMWCKHTNYEIDNHVPLIIRAPGMSGNGQHTDALVELIDLFPTFCQLAALPIPDQCEGESLVPYLQDPSRVGSAYAFNQYPRPRKTGGDIQGYAAKSSAGRYVEWINVDSGEVVAREFYDHTLDPDENQNRASDPAYAEVVKSHSAAIANEPAIRDGK